MKTQTITAVILTAFILVGCKEDPKETALLYNAWMKTHPGYDISQDEWNALRKEYLLPGQIKPQDDDSAAAMAIGMSSGMAMGIAAGGGRR